MTWQLQRGQSALALAQAGPASRSHQVTRHPLPLGLGKPREGQSPAEAAGAGRAGQKSCPATRWLLCGQRQQRVVLGYERWVRPLQQRQPVGTRCLPRAGQQPPAAVPGGSLAGEQRWDSAP